MCFQKLRAEFSVFCFEFLALFVLSFQTQVHARQAVQGRLCFQFCDLSVILMEDDGKPHTVNLCMKCCHLRQKEGTSNKHSPFGAMKLPTSSSSLNLWWLFACPLRLSILSHDQLLLDTCKTQFFSEGMAKNQKNTCTDGTGRLIIIILRGTNQPASSH